MNDAFDNNPYKKIVFIDSNLPLEAKPLPELPWAEIDPEGPILILIVHQVNKEIDSKKRDGRLGKRARYFNRLIGPAAETGRPARIVEGAPAVDIGIAFSDPPDWGKFGDLDPDEPDVRVVVQVLNTRGVPHERKVFCSYDTYPIAIASRYELGCFKVPEHWLLEPEPSPHEKEVNRLNSKLKILESCEPHLDLQLSFGLTSPVKIYSINNLSQERTEAIAQNILSRNPIVSQKRTNSLVADSSFDYTYERRYAEYRDKVVPRHVASVNRILEVRYGQVPFCLKLRNTGHLQAENLVLTLKASDGALHNRFTEYPVFGPIVPRPDPHPKLSPFLEPFGFQAAQVGRHEIEFVVGPNRGPMIEAHCMDFRHGCSWDFNGIATIFPRAPSPFIIEATVTASNKRGEVTASTELAYETIDVDVDDLVDLENWEYRIPYPMKEQRSAALESGDYKWFEFIDIEEVSQCDV